MMQTILHRLNLTSGNIVRILTDATAVGIVAFSAKPIFDALKGREWNSLPVIGVPFLLGTFILSQRARLHQFTVLPYYPNESRRKHNAS